MWSMFMSMCGGRRSGMTYGAPPPAHDYNQSYYHGQYPGGGMTSCVQPSLPPNSPTGL